MEWWIWFLVGLSIMVNPFAALFLWASNRIALKAATMRIEQLEKDRQETRADIKGLTSELHNLVVELARLNPNIHLERRTDA